MHNSDSSDGTKYNLQMIIPKQLQEKVLSEVHGGELSGHSGEAKRLESGFTGLKCQGV